MVKYMGDTFLDLLCEKQPGHTHKKCSPVMPFTLLARLTTPLSSMPKAVQYFTLINPLRYAIAITQRVYLEGAGLGRLMPDFWPLAVLAAVSPAAVAWMFRHRLT